MSLNPEPEDVDKIKTKLDRGLENKAQANAGKTRQVLDSSRRRSENKASPNGRAVVE